MWLCAPSTRSLSLLSKWSVSCLSQGQCVLFLDSPAGLAVLGKHKVNMWDGRETEQSVSNSSFFLHICWMWDIIGAVWKSLQAGGQVGTQADRVTFFGDHDVPLAGWSPGWPQGTCRVDSCYQTKENWSCFWNRMSLSHQHTEFCLLWSSALVSLFPRKLKSPGILMNKQRIKECTFLCVW